MTSSELTAFPLRSTSTTKYMSSARRTCVALHRAMVTLRTRSNRPPIAWKSKLEIVIVFAQSTTMAHRRSLSLFVFISALSEVQSIGWRQCSHFLQGKSSSLKSVSNVQTSGAATVASRSQDKVAMTYRQLAIIVAVSDVWCHRNRRSICCITMS